MYKVCTLCALLYKLLYKGLHVHIVNRSNVIVLIMFSLLDVFVTHLTQVKDQQEAEKRKVTSQEIQESLQVLFLHLLYNVWEMFGSLPDRFVLAAVHCIMFL